MIPPKVRRLVVWRGSWLTLKISREPWMKLLKKCVFSRFLLTKAVSSSKVLLSVLGVSSYS